MIKFTATKKESAIIRGMAMRAAKLLNYKDNSGVLDLIMDIEATHCNGSRLKLTELSIAKDFDFLHDITGISRHLNRTTGKLKNCFVPRYLRSV